MAVDEQGKPVARFIDFGLSSTDGDKIHPMGATLYQSYEKLSGREFDPKDSDRYATRVIKAFLYGAAHGEKSTVEIHLPNGKTVYFPATAAAVVKAGATPTPAPPRRDVANVGR